MVERGGYGDRFDDWLRDHPIGSVLLVFVLPLIGVVLTGFAWATSRPLGIASAVFFTLVTLLVFARGKRFRWTDPDRDDRIP